MQITDKVFVVTGGGTGIGREVVLQLLERGARVAAIDARPESLEQTAELAGVDDRLTLHPIDVGDQDAVARAFAELVSPTATSTACSTSPPSRSGPCRWSTSTWPRSSGSWRSTSGASSTRRRPPCRT